MGTFTANAAPRLHLAHPDVATAMHGGIGWTMATLRTWYARARTRSELRTLTDHVLADVGISRAEATKPFWQA
ncbi:MAG: DUF1127 domain-containing protein [Immundisolibacterales bacterium]|nr:DUF1127 domain-containing protein [Immundisolibacterales bacterium]